MIRDKILAKIAEEISYDEANKGNEEFEESISPETGIMDIAQEKSLRLRRGQAVKLMQALIDSGKAVL